MQFIQSYRQANNEKSDDNFSQASSSILLTESECPDYADFIDANEVQKKGEPVTGKRYLWFNIFMIVFLSVWVIVYDFKVVDIKENKRDFVQGKLNNTLVQNQTQISNKNETQISNKNETQISNKNQTQISNKNQTLI